MDFFFLETSDTFPAILWETAKVVMRGKIKAFATQKKERSKKRARASRRSQKVEILQAQKASDKTLKELIKTKQELNNIINKKIQHSLLQLRQHHYESGDKTRKLLSNQLKIQKERSNITAPR